MRLLPAAALWASLALGACQADAPAAPPPPPEADAIADETDTSRTNGLATVDAMQGTWRSLDDSAYVLRIEGDLATDLYEGELPRESAVRAVRSCEDPSPQPTSVFVVMDDGGPEPLCYEVLEASGDALALVYQARGNELRFERVRE